MKILDDYRPPRPGPRLCPSSVCVRVWWCYGMIFRRRRRCCWCRCCRRRRGRRRTSVWRAERPRQVTCVCVWVRCWYSVDARAPARGIRTMAENRFTQRRRRRRAYTDDIKYTVWHLYATGTAHASSS